MSNNFHFDMDATTQALRDGKDLSGQDSIRTPLT